MAVVVDLDDPEFLPPGDMPSRRPPDRRGAVVRCVLDGLALAYRRTVRRAAARPAGPATWCTSSVAVPATVCCGS